MPTLLPILVLLFSLMSGRADDFLLSYWCGPTQTEDLDVRHAEVAECGFTYAMPPCAGVTVEGNKKALTACSKHRLKYIVSDPRILKFSPDSPAFKTNLAAVISDYSGYESLGGYFIKDEPGPGAFPQLAAINRYLLEHDPKRLPFINLYPNYAPASALGGSYEQHIEKFLTTVKPRLLCFDHYALMKGDVERAGYFENLEIVRRQGLKHNVPIGFIFQMTAHFNYREVSEAELRWQANTALAYGAKALLYFTYWSPTNDPAFRTSSGIIDAQGQRTPHYKMAKQINAEIRTWAPTLMKLESEEVYHTGTLFDATRALPEDGVLQVKGDAALVIGRFKHLDGSEWIMVMNRNMRQTTQVGLQFGKGIKRVQELSNKTGRFSNLKLRKQELPLELVAGEAKLFKLSP